MNIISGKPTTMGVFALLAAAAVAVAVIHALPALAQELNTGPLAGFTLVDASDQSELSTLTDGASVELTDPGSGSYGIRADLADGETVGSVSMSLSGAKSVGPKTENLVPYSLYGDHQSGATRHLDGEPLPAGSYTITATAYSERRLGGDELGTLEVSFTITANRAPEFGSAAYNFSVAEDAETGFTLGSVAATDADEDTLTYSMTRGRGRLFAINGDTGAVTLRGELDYEKDSSHTLTVRADDGNGGSSTAVVNISVTDVEDLTASVNVPTNLAAKASHNGVKLTWTLPVQPDDVVLDEMYLERLDAGDTVEWSYGMAADIERVVEASDWGKVDGDRESGTEYRYRVKLTGDTHGDAYSDVVAVTTETDPPLAPTDLSAVVENDQVTVTWRVPEQPSWVDNYSMSVRRVYGREFPGGDWVSDVQWERDTETYRYTDTVPWLGLLDYSYRIRIAGEAWGNYYSEPVTVEVPRENIALDAESSHDLVDLSWTMPQPEADDWRKLTTMDVLRDGVVVHTQQWQLNDLSYDYLDHDVEPETTYEYRIRTAIGGYATASPTVSIATEAAPAAPASVLERLTSGANSAVRTGTTEDGVPYVEFLKAAPASVPTSGALNGNPQPRHWNIAAMEQWNPVTGAFTPQNQDSGEVVVEPISPRGIWSDGTTLWVTAQESDTDTNEKLFAYVLDTGARDPSKDIDIAEPARNNATGLWVTDDTVWVSTILPSGVLAYHRHADATADPPVAAGDRNTDQDFTLLDADYASPLGLWSDGSSMYVATGRRQVHVYDLATRTYQGRLPTTPFGNNSPTGVWSDGITMWVADTYSDVVYAYAGYDALESNVWPRRRNMEITSLSEDNGSLRDIWSDGMQLWVMDEDAGKAFIYDLPDDADLSSLEVSGVNLAAFSPETTDYNRNVAGDVTHVTVDAVARRGDAAVAIVPADASAADGHQVRLVENGETSVTINVTDGDATKTYILTLTQLEDTTGTLSDDDSLSALSLSGFTLNRDFEGGVLDYQVQITEDQFEDGLTTTVTATPGNAGAAMNITPGDSDEHTAEHQVTTDGGRVTVTVSVTAQDGSTTRTYTVDLTTIVRNPGKDFILEKSVFDASDLWSDGETMWVLNEWFDIHAYDLDAGTRLPAQDYDLEDSSRIGNQLSGMWSDGDIIWVSDLYQVGPSDGETKATQVEAIDAQSYDPIVEIPSQDFVPRDRSLGVRDLWSDGETFWVSWVGFAGTALEPVATTLAGKKLYAYDHETKARKESSDIPVATEGHFYKAAHPGWSFGTWSDDTTIWIVSNMTSEQSKLEAYRLSNGDRIPARDVLVGEDGFLEPKSMWSDGRNMWVLSEPTNYPERTTSVRAYDLPPNAKLFSLELSDVDFGRFIHGKSKYAAEVANGVDETTVAYEQAFTGGSAAVAISAADADGTTVAADADTDAEGYQVNLAEGENVITITVTAPNGTDSYAYTVTVTRAPSQAYRGQLADVFLQLTRSTFENAAPQTSGGWVKSTDDATTSIVYVIDDSGSMDGDFPEVRTALTAVKGETMDNTKVALITFGTTPKTLFALTAHSSTVWTEAHVNSFGGSRGGTKHKIALQKAKELLDADDADTKKVIFFTDSQPGYPTAEVNAMKAASIVVDTIGFGEKRFSREFTALEKVATDTGGTYKKVNPPSQGTTNDPAVTAEGIETILKDTVADSTATLFLLDYSFSVYADREGLTSALTAAAAKAGTSTGAQVGLASFIGDSTLIGTPTADVFGVYKYKVVHSIGSTSLGLPDEIAETSTGSTDIDNALSEAFTTVSAATTISKRVVLISDGISATAVKDATLNKYKNNSNVTLDVVAWGAHADRVQLKTWADAASGNFSVAESE